MKKKNIALGFLALSLLATSVGATSVMAASNTKNISVKETKIRQNKNLTEAEKTEMKTKMDAVKAAIESSDYNAWVKAEKAINENSPMLKKITADTFSNYVTQYKEREIKMTEMKTKIDAVKAAIEANDYSAWVTAEKAMNENSPMLTKITSANFSKYVEANKLREQANTLMKDLGINNDGKGGEGHGPMHDFDNNTNENK